MRYIKTYSPTANDCIVNSIAQIIDVNDDTRKALLQGPDVFWQERMIDVLNANGMDVELQDYTRANGKSPMHGFAFDGVGTYILYMDGHVCTIKEGVLYDRTDTRWNKVYWTWKIINKKQNRHETQNHRKSVRK